MLQAGAGVRCIPLRYFGWIHLSDRFHHGAQACPSLARPKSGLPLGGTPSCCSSSMVHQLGVLAQQLIQLSGSEDNPYICPHLPFGPVYGAGHLTLQHVAHLHAHLQPFMHTVSCFATHASFAHLACQGRAQPVCPATVRSLLIVAPAAVAAAASAAAVASTAASHVMQNTTHLLVLRSAPTQSLPHAMTITARPSPGELNPCGILCAASNVH